MKKVWLAFIVCFIVVFLVGCDGELFYNGPILRVEDDYYVDEYTDVVYIVYRQYKRGGIVPATRPDGTMMSKSDFDRELPKLQEEIGCTFFRDDFFNVVYIVYQGYSRGDITPAYKLDGSLLSASEIDKDLPVIREGLLNFTFYVDDLSPAIYIVYNGYEKGGITPAYKPDGSIASSSDIQREFPVIHNGNTFTYYMDEKTHKIYIVYHGYMKGGITPAYKIDGTVLSSLELGEEFPILQDSSSFSFYSDTLSDKEYIVYHGYEQGGIAPRVRN